MTAVYDAVATAYKRTLGSTKRAIVVVAFTLASCSSQVMPAATPTHETATLRVFANSATAPLIHNLTRAYHQANPGITFDIATGSYRTMLERVQSGEAPYLISNHLGEDDSLWAAPIGQDGIAVIVNPANPVAALTTTQLRDVYQGWIGNWSSLGGNDEPIVVFTRDAGSGTRAEFETLIMGDRRTTPTAQVVPSSEAMLLSVARTPGAVGFVSMSYLDDTVRALSIDGVVPTRENVFANSYPLRSIIYIIGLREPISPTEPDMHYRAFFGWVQSPAGQAVVAQGYAPLIQP